MASGQSFPKGVRARINIDCSKCEVALAQPILENENIVSLYMALPPNYDGFSGLRIVSAKDIEFILKVYGVPRELWDEYYTKMVLLHNYYLEARMKLREAEEKAIGDKG